MLIRILQSIYEVSLEAAPWLVLGLVVAGLIHAFLPPTKVTKWLGGHGLGSILNAALLGAPLPLCSCGVLPVAVGLRKAGASRGATSSFMVSTPETGVDSVSITYALMGPVFAITRPIAAIASAIVTGLLVEWFGAPKAEATDPTTRPLPIAPQPKSCCSTTQPKSAADDCCATPITTDDEPRAPMHIRLAEGQRYAATRLIDDLSKWLVVGLVVAGLMDALIAPDALARWGSGPAAYAVMLLIGLPLYVCATASTPIAASMLIAGVAPGPVLVFLMAGPATNIATLGVLKRELGIRSIAPYLIGVGGVALAFGLAIDALFASGTFRIAEVSAHAHDMLPHWIALACLVWLAFIALRPLRRPIFAALGIERPITNDQAAPEDCCSTVSPAKPAAANACCSHTP